MKRVLLTTNVIVVLAVVFALSACPTGPGSTGPTEPPTPQDPPDPSPVFRGEKALYWTSWDRIQRATVENSRVEDLVISGPSYLFPHVAGSALYWVEDGKRIRRANLDGTNSKIIVETNDETISAVRSYNGKLYWYAMEEETARIWRAELDGSGRKDIVTISVTTPHFFGHLDYGIAVFDDKMYWTEHFVDESNGDFVYSSVIRRADVAGSARADVVTVPQALVYRLAVSPSDDKLYWSEVSLSGSATSPVIKIKRAASDGGDVDMVAVADSAAFITEIVPHRDKLYWSEASLVGGTPPAIRRADLDGTDPESIYVGEAAAGIWGLTVDSANGRLYWGLTTDTHGSLVRANLDGGNRRTLEEHQRREFRAIAVDVTGKKMYWAQQSGYGFVGKALQTVSVAELDGSAERVLLTIPDRLNVPVQLALDAAEGRMYWIEEVFDPPDCYEGACGQGPSGDHVFRSANLDGSGMRKLAQFPDSSHATIEIDMTGRKLYWFDYEITERDHSERVIRRANFDRSEEETIIRLSGGSFEVLEVDRPGRKLYWAGTSGVRRANLDGSGVEVVSRVDLEINRQLVVDSSDGKLYYDVRLRDDEDRETYLIRVANLDGSGARDFAELDWPLDTMVLGAR